jgi:hypothetical protein
MALMFNSNVKILFAGAIFKTLANSNLYYIFNPCTVGMTIYSGTIPTPAAIAASWATYNSSSPNYLAHFTNATWFQPSQGSLLQITGFPTPVTPVNNGTASWAIIWAGQPSPAQLSGTTLPFASFLVVSVSDTVGDGVIRFASTTFTTGSTVSVEDGSIGVNL